MRDNEVFPIAKGTQIMVAEGQYRTTADNGYFMTDFYLKEAKKLKLKDPDLD